MLDLKEYLAEKRRLVDTSLDEALPRDDNESAVLHRAMRYSVFAGGKRVRPILAMTAAEVVSGDAESVLPLAVALECIHTYSLIHDDLPAMDDDDFRRGKPTAHKVFGDAIAILAGDGLLTFAFEVLTSPATVRCYRLERLLAVIQELAVAAGSTRLVAGQAMDVLNEGKTVSLETVDSIVKAKTAALIRASLTCGARLAGADESSVQVLGRYGDYLGAVFQIRDDLLDLEGDPGKLGKAVKKDQSRGKATYPTLLGVEATREMMMGLVNSAVDAVEHFGDTAEPLILIARYVGERTS